MMNWTIKTLTDDPDRALEIAQEQRNRGFTAWIEDDRGQGVDEEALQNGKPARSKPTLYDREVGILVIVAAVVVAIGTLYLVGVWVDH
jgi:alpha-beta hydrolase superfamily lysophospholipase